MILTIASLKGGSGKSTLAGALALHWQRPAVDGDPQGSLKRWRGLDVKADATERIARTIGAAGADVVVDTAGFKNRTSIAALVAADVVLIPCKASALDLPVAVETWRLVQDVNETEERENRPIVTAVALRDRRKPGGLHAARRNGRRAYGSATA